MGRSNGLTRIAWFVGLWFASVTALGIVAFLIKLVI